jgi:acetone monooxygenase (methyl acetate-forming)
MKDLDVIVIGAGFTGLYALYSLRARGLEVRAFEAGGGAGGTWYWNRYPGARTDSPSYLYQFWFSDELLDEWDWSERFPAQEETERYLNFVADKFDLRKDVQFNTRVTTAEYDEAAGCWTITTEGGEQLSAQFLVMGTGVLTKIVLPDIPGRDDFEGEWYHTANWPKGPVDFDGKRVGVFGTGATGIQVIQTIASQVGHLTVFQRTPTYTIPIRNPRFDDAARTELRARYPEMRECVHHTFAGFDFTFDPRSIFELPEEERRKLMEELWADGSLRFWVGSFVDVLTERAANDVFSEFVREKIRARIDDPEVAAKLIPTGYAFGTRRVPLENNYYEAFNRDNVALVDLKEAPVERITPRGVTTTAGDHELDMIIYATGFDAATGALTQMDIRGRNGALLREIWADDIRSFMGLQVHGYPNMFMVNGPLSPAAAFCNAPTCIQQQVDWITDCIAYVRGKDHRSIEPTVEAESGWVEHSDELASQTLFPSTDSWYMGANIEGKSRRLLAYVGGVGVYRELCDEVKAKGYDAFELV